MVNDEQLEERRGTVRRADPTRQPAAGDVQFAPDYTVTSTTDGGGMLLTNVEVILCFWGSFWSKTPAPTPSSDDYKTAIEGILTGPFMGGRALADVCPLVAVRLQCAVLLSFTMRHGRPSLGGSDE